MGKRRAARVLAAVSLVVTTGIVALPAVHASVVVEEIEAYEKVSGVVTTHYAPVDFAGNLIVTPPAGAQYAGITFHALDGVVGTLSSHAAMVGSLIFDTGAVGAPYVSDVYSDESTSFIYDTVQASNILSTTAVAPAHFDGGAEIINDSFVASMSNTVDFQRRLDFMINRDDVTLVAGAATPTSNSSAFATWSSYNSLAVSGDQSSFNPAASPGKTHADLELPGYASFTAANVSSDAAGLYGHAQSAGQIDATHGVVIRSLLMAGADKTAYARQTANNLDTVRGAGQPNYNSSLSILQSGERAFDTVAADGTIIGGADANPRGWAYGTIVGGSATQSAVIVHVPNAIRGVTASLNWNVTQSQQTSDTIDTTDAGLIFPNLSLQLLPVNLAVGNGGGTPGSHSVLGASLGDPGLLSAATNDNVQYLYSTNPLPAGDYAFVITGDPSAARSVAVGFSYDILTSVNSQWTSSMGGSWSAPANWSAGIPMYQADHATLLAVGATGPVSIALDGNRTVGQLTFGDAASYSIDPGSTGTLTIDDTGDTAGVSPLVTVVAGNQQIKSPLVVAAGTTVNAAASASLTIAGNVTGAGGLTKSGAGALVLSGAANTYGDTRVQAGTFTLSSGASITNGNLIVSAGAIANINGTLAASTAVTVSGALNFAGNTGSTPRSQSLASLQIGSGATVTITPSVSAPAVLVPGSLTLADVSSKLNIGNNELISPTPLSAVRAWIAAGQITGSISSELAIGSLDLGGGQTEICCTLLGDTNLDGRVDVQDMGNICTHFGQSSGAVWEDGDFNYDGAVDVADLGSVASNFGVILPTFSGASTLAAGRALVSDGDTSPATVPEPALGALLILCTTASVRRRCRRISPA